MNKAKLQALPGHKPGNDRDDRANKKRRCSNVVKRGTGKSLNGREVQQSQGTEERSSLPLNIGDTWAFELHASLHRDLVPDDCYDSLYDSRKEPCEVFYERQTAEFLKKYVPSSTDPEEIGRATTAEFLACQELLRGDTPRLGRWLDYIRAQFDSSLNNDLPRPPGMPEWLPRVLVRAQWMVRDILGESPSVEELIYHADFGPGTAVGVPFADTSVTRKLRFPITVTRDCAPLFLELIRADSLLKQAILAVNASPDGTVADKITLRIVEGDTFGVVPKRADIGRGISPQPVGNAICQACVGNAMADRLQRHGLDLSTLQEYHRKLAKIASRDGRLATIDMKSASDLLHLLVVRFLYELTPEWLLLMEKCRCSSTKVDSNYIESLTFSTMGNGFTFPSETLLFYVVAASCTQERSPNPLSLIPEWGRLKTVSCYGDDVICRTEVAEDLISAFTALGFVVNESKSFIDPLVPFRESCGVDAFKGENIRPYCVKAVEGRPNVWVMEAWLYKIFNEVLPRYIQYCGPRATVESSFLETWTKLFLTLATDLKICSHNMPSDSGVQLLYTYQDINIDTIALVGTEREIRDRLLELGCKLPIPRRDERYNVLLYPVLKWNSVEKRDTLDEVRLWKMRRCFTSLIFNEIGNFAGEDVHRTSLSTPLAAALNGPATAWVKKIKKGSTLEWDSTHHMWRDSRHVMRWISGHDMLYASPDAALVLHENDGVLHRAPFVDVLSDSARVNFIVIPGVDQSAVEIVDRRLGHYAKAWVALETFDVA